MDLLERHPAGASTHDVTNQPPPLAAYDVYGADAALRAAVAENGASWAEPALHEVGRRAGSVEAIAWGFEANANPPETQGLRSLWVSCRRGRVPSVVSRADGHRRRIRHPCVCVERSARGIARRARRNEFHVVASRRGPHVSHHDDARRRTRAPRRAGSCEALGAARVLALVRWATRARSSKGFRDFWHGHDGEARWLRRPCQHDDRDAARSAAAPVRSTPSWDTNGFAARRCPMRFSCSLRRPAGSRVFSCRAFCRTARRTRSHLQRLKDKLGNKSNASSEVEFDNTLGVLIGDEGRGVHTIVEMVNFTRLDCIIG